MKRDGKWYTFSAPIVVSTGSLRVCKVVETFTEGFFSNGKKHVSMFRTFFTKSALFVYIYAKNEFWVWHFFQVLGHGLIYAVYNAFFDHMCKITVEKFEPQNIGTQKIKTQKNETQKNETPKNETQKMKPM